MDASFAYERELTALREENRRLRDQAASRECHDFEPDTSMTIMRCSRCGEHAPKRTAAERQKAATK